VTTNDDDQTRESESVDTHVEQKDSKDNASQTEAKVDTSKDAASDDESQTESSVSSDASDQSLDDAEDLADDEDLNDVELMDEGFAEDELPPAFERLVTSLDTNEDDEIEGLEPPASEEGILAAEKRLAFTFPENFRNFLSYWNGGTVHQVCIYGVEAEDDFDIVEFNKRSHYLDDFPKEFIAFASTVVGDIFCFQRDWEEDDDAPVFLYDAENGTAVETSKSFIDWLDHLPTLEQDISAAQQPQPMSVEEWKSFLDRERAKLRTLSKTPAKDLFMPDPEAIRAKLNNKIPVDPRHLKPKT
jgi:hypothetical protein